MKSFSEVKNGRRFKSWYWLKEEMKTICSDAKIALGSKFQFRDRIATHLDNNLMIFVKKKGLESSFLLSFR